MTNSEMVNAIDMMSTLNETGKLGYAIARNLRILKTEATEYIQLRSELFTKYGTQDGAQVKVPPDKVKDFLAELGDIPNIEHDVKLYKIPEEEFLSGTLTSPQMEALLFMVEEDNNGNVQQN